jgi:hypothetical protein
MPEEAACPVADEMPHRGEFGISRNVVVGVLHERLRPSLCGASHNPAACFALVDDVDRTHRLTR